MKSAIYGKILVKLLSKIHICRKSVEQFSRTDVMDNIITLGGGIKWNKALLQKSYYLNVAMLISEQTGYQQHS